jgi:predicted dehydrogenase
MRVGIAGAGLMGATHAAAWATTGAAIAGFVAASSGEAERLAAQYGAVVYPSYGAMLDDVEIVDICTPTHLHHEMALAAAAAGRQIICEKPLARTVEQGQEMIAACEIAGVQLHVAQVVRFFPEYARAKALVAAGAVGRPAVLRLHRGSFRPRKPEGNWFLDEEKSGGIILDMMIHDFDYARWVAGEVETVFAKQVGRAHPGAPVEYAMAILTHAGGAISHVSGAWAYPPPTFRTKLEIAGDGGLIEHDSAAAAPIELLLGRGAEGGDVGLPASPLAESPFATQLAELYAAIAGGATPRVRAADGLAALQIALAAIESARTGEPVRLSSLPEVQP